VDSELLDVYWMGVLISVFVAIFLYTHERYKDLSHAGYAFVGVKYLGLRGFANVPILRCQVHFAEEFSRLKFSSRVEILS